MTLGTSGSFAGSKILVKKPEILAPNLGVLSDECLKTGLSILN
jgi:hypothetical protein